jgi:acetyltransferase-like isoleucine patch superfamily enzyme
MRLLARRLTRLAGVRAGRDVAVGRDVQLSLAPGALLVLGDGCRIGERTRIVVNHGVVEVGAGAIIGPRCTIVAHAGVSIGAGAWLQEGTVIVDFDHVFDDVERPIRAQPLTAGAVTIGEGARIGLGASVLRGVSVGARAIVGPHAVVTRDVPAGASVGGVPARAPAPAAEES